MVCFSNESIVAYFSKSVQCFYKKQFNFTKTLLLPINSISGLILFLLFGTVFIASQRYNDNINE